MHPQLALVKQFHEKFKVPVLAKPSLIPPDRSDNLHRLMKDEVEEYLAEVKQGSIETISKELADILYTVYGAILEHGLQDRMEALFEEVHQSNMSKDYHQYKMIKGPSFFKADIKKFFPEQNKPPLSKV